MNPSGSQPTTANKYTGTDYLSNIGYFMWLRTLRLQKKLKKVDDPSVSIIYRLTIVRPYEKFFRTSEKKSVLSGDYNPARRLENPWGSLTVTDRQNDS